MAAGSYRRMSSVLNLLLVSLSRVSTPRASTPGDLPCDRRKAMRDDGITNDHRLRHPAGCGSAIGVWRGRAARDAFRTAAGRHAYGPRQDRWQRQPCRAGRLDAQAGPDHAGVPRHGAETIGRDAGDPAGRTAHLAHGVPPGPAAGIVYRAQHRDELPGHDCGAGHPRRRHHQQGRDLLAQPLRRVPVHRRECGARAQADQGAHRPLRRRAA